MTFICLGLKQHDSEVECGRLSRVALRLIIWKYQNTSVNLLKKSQITRTTCI